MEEIGPFINKREHQPIIKNNFKNQRGKILVTVIAYTLRPRWVDPSGPE